MPSYLVKNRAGRAIFRVRSDLPMCAILDAQTLVSDLYRQAGKSRPEIFLEEEVPASRPRRPADFRP